MSRDRAAADRAVIDAARAIERAVQYGIDTAPAHRSYDQARQRRDRQGRAS